MTSDKPSTPDLIKSTLVFVIIWMSFILAVLLLAGRDIQQVFGF